MKVLVAARRLQIGSSRRATPPLPGVHLVIAGTGDVAPAEIRRARNADFRRGIEKRIGERIHPAGVLDPDSAFIAMKLVRAALLTLRFPEVRQDILIGPAGSAHLLPDRIVGGHAAHVDQAVDRARAAQHLPAQRRNPTSSQVRLRIGLEVPHEPRIGQDLGEPHRQANPATRILRSGFEQEDAGAAILAQPRGNHRAARACADHHEVIFGFSDLHPVHPFFRVTAGSIRWIARHVLFAYPLFNSCRDLAVSNE